jgi:(p)ppGpp synthase/HD superfamily hydrolase
MLGKAIAIAAAAHADQTDSGGRPYILHALRVMTNLNTTDEELMSIAVLHDVVEDTHWTIEDLKNEGFSARVLNGVALLTHDDAEPYMDYVQRISASHDATRVKLADLKDNSDITRLRGVREKDIERMKRYHFAFTFLTNVEVSRSLLCKL